MATLEATTMKHCTQCEYKTPSESSIRRHILDRECPAGSNSYKES